MSQNLKKIMILGGGENQLPLIKKAKELGYITVVCDYQKDCVGFKHADICHLVSIKDEEQLLTVAKNEGVLGIVTNSELVLHIVSNLTQQLGLPTVPDKITERFRNKGKMRECLTPMGLSDVRYRVCHQREDAVSFFRNINKHKCIIKPLDNSSSRGVYSINNEQDIIDHFDESIGMNRTHAGVLMEEYISGREFTVDGICVNGKHTTLAISKKKHFDYNENVANELFFSYQDAEYNYDELRLLNNQIIEAAGLNFGLTHAEYKYSNGKYHLIEVAARGGGAFISTDIVPFLTKTDTVGAYLESAMGLYSNSHIIIPEDSKQRVAVLKFFSTPDNKSGIVKKIIGVDYLETSPNILRYGLEFSIGDSIHPATNDGDRIGYYIAIAEDKQELHNIMEEVERSFNILFDE